MHSQQLPISRAAFLATVVALSLSACGGGGSDGGVDDPTAPSASPVTGFWAGTLPNGNRLFGTVLEDGTAIVPYTSATGGVAGLVLGTFNAVAGGFSATSATDFHWSSSRVVATTITGNYTPQQMTGVAVHPDLGSFSLTLTRASGFDRTATLGDFQGLWVGDLAQPGVFWRGGTANVGSDGRVTMQLFGGCSYVGQLKPRTEGGAVMGFTASFEGGACAGQPTQTGVAYVNDGVLTLATVGPNRSTAAVARMRRQ